MNIETIVIQRDILKPSQIEADAWRRSLTARGILCVNVIASPGAGKTSLLQATARFWNHRRKMAVLVGDIATDRDAQRLSPLVPVKQLTTGGACHLELPLVQSGFEAIDREGLEFLFIENIGNLVCPTSFDLGEHLRVVVLSVTEGDDKPGKYPKAFRTSHACVINKCDLLPHVPFDCDVAKEDVRLVNSELPIFETSAWKGTGIEPWCEFMEEQHALLLKSRETKS
jgi:hydrogenase nickel incorporation protein HypB